MPIAPTIVAHRGSSGHAPENTLPAFLLAIQDGADGIELDLQETVDGELIVFHDTSLQRVAHRPQAISESSWKDLRQVDVGTWFSPAFAQVTIPRLEEVLALARDRIALNIEIKAFCNQSRMIKKLLDLIHAYGMEKSCVISSLLYSPLVEVKRLAPALPCGRICDTQLEDSLHDPLLNFLSVHASLLTPHLAAWVHAQTKALHVWNVDSPPIMHQSLTSGVDTIITNFPAQVRALLAALSLQ